MAATPCGGCQLSRRQFVQTSALAACGAWLTGCGGGADEGPIGPPPSGVTITDNTVMIDLALATALTGAPGFLVARALTPVLVARFGSGFVAYDARCPHEQATQQWSISGGTFVCTKHDSVFQILDGALVSGKARRGMNALAISRTADVLTIQAAYP